jgi:hypothetical protein
MISDEDAVRAATVRFYEAIDAMTDGKGLELMREAWHHTPRVTSGHPSGDWAQGWDEVFATWEVFAMFGRKGRGGATIRDLHVYIYGGDLAYTTCTFTVPPTFGGEKLSCTNVLARVDGVWKIVHHHADKAPAMGAALEKLATEGR